MHDQSEQPFHARPGAFQAFALHGIGERLQGGLAEVFAASDEGRIALRQVGGTLQKVGKRAVDHARNHTFHYPTLNEKYESDAELVRVLRDLANEAVELGKVEGRPGRVRFVFADKVALMVAMGKHSTENRDVYWGRVTDLQAGAAAFVNFVGVAVTKRLKTEVPKPG